jgi:long-subunit acyl-CoA synthetase (AMP-forming)
MSTVQHARTLCDALTETVATYSDAPALRSADGATEWTWPRYGERVHDAAAGLAGIGVGRGDTVALWLSNRPEFHVADTAAMQLVSRRTGGHVIGRRAGIRLPNR